LASITQIDKYNSLIPKNEFPVLAGPSSEEDVKNRPEFMHIERSLTGHWTAKSPKIPVLIPDSRELGWESGLLKTASTAITTLKSISY
jgi:hypothetical protein